MDIKKLSKWPKRVGNGSWTVGYKFWGLGKNLHPFLRFKLALTASFFKIFQIGQFERLPLEMLIKLKKKIAQFGPFLVGEIAFESWWEGLFLGNFGYFCANLGNFCNFCIF